MARGARWGAGARLGGDGGGGVADHDRGVGHRRDRQFRGDDDRQGGGQTVVTGQSGEAAFPLLAVGADDHRLGPGLGAELDADGGQRFGRHGRARQQSLGKQRHEGRQDPQARPPCALFSAEVHGRGS